ncbi:MAG TPA: ABC transporter ATP-binding protein [Candidatus Pelethosoma merdigallinarum]|nr:ABC transporter ATP-binding protein [Candidatus Pelethosoma merdigallinarum]
MVKILKYLKSSWISIVVIIALLIGQAMCDLSLPDYTSNIVNVGIQQGGIEETAPKVIRASSMDKLLLLMDEKDADTIQNSYTYISKDHAKEEEIEDYPALEKEDVYELKDLSKEELDSLESLMSKPMMMLSMLSDEKVANQIVDDIVANTTMEFATRPDLFTLLEQMPEDIKKEMLAESEKQVKGMPDSVVDQAAVAYVREEYKAVGLNTDSIQTNYIFITGLKMLGLALASMTATILVGLLGARLAARLGRTLRKNVFTKVMDFSKTEMKEFSTASLITRTTNDVQQVQMVMVMLLRVCFYAPIIGIGGVIKSMDTNSSMAWIIAVAVMAVLSIVIVLFALATPKFKVFQKFVDRLNLVTREILSGLPVIRAFATEKVEEERFDDANLRLSKLALFIDRTMGLMMPLMMLTMNTIVIVILWKGSYAIDDGLMQVGDIMAYIQYTMQIIMAFLMISVVSIILPRASVSAKRITEVLDTDIAIKDPEEEGKERASEKGVVEFKDVSFHYPDAEENVIEHISFKAMPGKTTAFIGSTGSGKTTVINLIPRFYDVTEGSITVDGVDVRKMKTKKLRDKIGFVPQKGVLFTGTVRSNIKYSDPTMSDERMVKAAEIAQATEFIEALPNQYDYEIAQGGTNVSGGQKQRLSIARAIAKDPEIYIFDDSFSALDFKTDAILRSELKKVTKNSTVLIVAQRISTILHADQIVVLNEGKIAGIGTHKQLMKNCDVYKEIALSQLSEEELEHGK